MAQDIRQKIVLEGEKEYSAAIKDAQRNLKTLKSELKAETAELGKNATAQQKAEVKTKSLQKQIAEQEKIVKANREALEEVRAKYGDNAEAVAKWEQKLNESRATLANMKNSLEDVSSGMKSVETSTEMGVVAANSFADSLQKVADAGGSISSAIEDAFTSIASKIAETVQQVWESVVDLAARSNNLVDLAGFWNTDVTTIQKYQGAVAEVSGTLEDLSGLVTKINSKDSKKITELVGVSKENYKDQWEYAMAVMDAMSKMSTEQRNAAGFELFGKGATKAFDLLNDWDKVLANLDKYDVEKGGYGLTEEQLNNMSDLYDKVNGLKQSWQSLKDMATVQLFGDLALNITGNLQNIVDAFKEYFQADNQADKDAALQKVKDNIIEIFRNIKDAIDEGLKMLDELAEELKGSDDSTARALGNVLSTIVDALEWFTKEENWQAVKIGFEALIGIWAAGKIASAVGNLAAFVAHLTTIGIFNGGSAAASAASAGSAAGASWGSAFASAAMKAAPFLAFLYTLCNPSSGSDALGNNDLLDENGNLTAEAQAYGFKLDENGELYQDPDALDPKYVTPEHLEWLKNQPKEEVEYVDLEDEPRVYTAEDMDNAVQDWWDAWRDGADDEESAFEYLKEVFGDDFGAVWDQIIAKLDEMENQTNMEDIPSDWWSSVVNKDGLTSEDISGFRSVPGLMLAAVRNGVSGIKVSMDGRTVGTLVAPYVSQMIARDMA